MLIRFHRIIRKYPASTSVPVRITKPIITMREQLQRLELTNDFFAKLFCNNIVRTKVIRCYNE